MHPHAMLRDLVDLGVEETPQNDPYEDESQNAEMFPLLDINERYTLSGGTSM